MKWVWYWENFIKVGYIKNYGGVWVLDMDVEIFSVMLVNNLVVY